MRFYYLMKLEAKRLITNTSLKPALILYNLGNSLTSSFYKFALILSRHLSLGIPVCFPTFLVSRMRAACHECLTFL
jgi:hypothetical protein